DFTWDGTMNTGNYEGMPDGEEPTNIAPEGLYTFDVEVTGVAPYDYDWLRSKELKVVPGPVEYYGYDDGGTPDDESDDNYLYYLRWYALYSGRDATWGEIWLYDPDLMRVSGWAVPILWCVVHGWNDGLVANPNGEVHSVIIPVPVSVMDKVGTYRFVLHFYDDYADSYKNHQVKAALEVNAPAKPFTFVVSTDPDGDSQQGHPGYHEGEREKIKFYVIIKAKIKWLGEPPFKTISFLLRRAKTGERWLKTGYLVTDLNDPDGPKDVGGGIKEWTFRTHKTLTDRGITDWIVTKMKGRFEIKVSPPHESNTVKFKIDKRAQIVILANSWAGATSTELGSSMCFKFTARVYNHVGISLPEKLDPPGGQYDKTELDEGQGCLIFYAINVSPTWDPAHVGIQDGQSIIDINCALGHPDDIRKHLQSELASKYKDSKKKAPSELIALDSE
ncbi:MAG: hypothetical protein QXQ50_10195, partial [Candidatus Bathyarchaeia archaeon]